MAGDVGGGRALVPVIKKLKEGEHTLFLFAYRSTIDLWRHLGIDDFTVVSYDMGIGEINRLIRALEPQIVVTGTSLNHDSGTADVEKRFIQAARAQNIPTLAVLDFWGNYAARFSDKDGNLVYLPDKIAVMDEQAFCEMVRHNVDPERMLVTGQPTYDDLEEFKKTTSPSTRNKIRKSFGVGKDGVLVMFASQPVEDLYGNEMGYTEKGVVNLLIKTLEGMNENITLLIRPHPRENEDYYKLLKSEKIPIIVSKDWDYRHQIVASDIVIGMTTALMIEACYLGKIVVSVQPHMSGEDMLPTNRGGWSYLVLAESELKPLLTTLLFDKEVRTRALENVGALKYHGNATDNIVGLINSMVGIW